MSMRDIDPPDKSTARCGQAAGAIVIKMPQRLECSSCGATANAACDCGAPYVPAGVRAADAIAANPEKSDRRIAKEIGVSQPTVSKARKQSTDNSLSVDKRIGLDGKTRKLPEKISPPVADVRADDATASAAQRKAEYAADEDEPSVEDELDEDPENFRTAFLLRADQARAFAVYTGPVIDRDLIAAARAAATAWTKLANDLEEAAS
jgi:hypothetical protein